MKFSHLLPITGLVSLLLAAAPEAQEPADTQSPDIWQVVGYWDYDATDGQHLADNGLVLRKASGSNLGQQWQGHLELKNHASLPSRNRSLWPVKINAGQRKVCANYPGYPSYSAFIDMPGDTDDGIYQIAECKGE